jgi:peroxiredoxin Q/BCP
MAAKKKAKVKKAAPKKAAATTVGKMVGKKAPAFVMQADDGLKISLADLKGKNVILYFYPKDDTPGCTTEACDFTASLPNFSKANAVVIGVSKDSVAKHQKFKAKYKLKHILGADEDGKVCAAYNTWVEKSLYGRKYMGIERSTFLIDSAGIVRGEWRGVKVKDHAAEVLAAAKAL